MRLYPIFWLLILGLQTSWARPTQVILLRHAEKPEDDANVHLSARGGDRALALASFLTTNSVMLTNGRPVALYAAQFTRRGHSRRTQETLEPLSRRLKLPIQAPYPASGFADLAKDILNDSAYDGKTVVICWVHDYLPELAKALGLKRPPSPWKSSVFDRVWVISYRGKRPKLVDLPQHLLPGDSSQ